MAASNHLRVNRSNTFVDVPVNPLTAQLTHRPFAQVAEALRDSAQEVTLAWVALVRKSIPRMAKLSYDELKDSTPLILLAIADAMASGNPDDIGGVMSRSPMQGLSRFFLKLDVVEILQEDRLLRALTVQHLEEKLGRQMDVVESAALHAAIDVMLQQSVIAIVESQKGQLRAAAETELKYLTFLNHDLNNNLNNISLAVEVLQMHLEKMGGLERFREDINTAREAIAETTGGMRQMLSRARLNSPGKAPTLLPVKLHAVVTAAAARFSTEARQRGVSLAVEVDPVTVIETDAELLALILQNLIGNAVKYSSSGTVRIGCDSDAPHAESGSRAPVLWVSDEGPGIEAQMAAKIFDAFQRGEGHAEDGIGLGLTIATEAAKLLNARLTVDSRLGIGSTFRLALQTETGQLPS